MRAFKFIIPIMVIVAWASWALLNRSYSEVPETTRLYITIGAVLVSGVIAYFLFPEDEIPDKDEKR